MAKAKFDFKSIEVPAAAQKPLYAGVGAGDLAVTAVLEYVADVQKKITGYQKDAQTKVAGVQKSVTEIDPKSLRDSALSVAKARRTAIEARVAELQAEALALPTKVQTAVNDNVTTVTSTVVGTYGDLAKRGEAVVRGTKLPSTATVEVKVNTTIPKAKKAPVRTPAVKKATTAATTTAAKKVTAVKKSTPVKKATTATKTATAATATAAKTATSAVTPSVDKA